MAPPPSPTLTPHPTTSAPALEFPTTDQSGTGRAVLRALRPHQWVKNVLVLVPLVTSHQIVEPSKVAAALVALAAFCLCASGGYVVNDLLDREADRRHPTKRLRPFASGSLSTRAGVVMAAALLVLSLGVALLTRSAGFVGAVALYFTVSVLYSVWLKEKLLLDVLV